MLTPVISGDLDPMILNNSQLVKLEARNEQKETYVARVESEMSQRKKRGLQPVTLGVGQGVETEFCRFMVVSWVSLDSKN